MKFVEEVDMDIDELKEELRDALKWHHHLRLDMWELPKPVIEFLLILSDKYIKKSDNVVELK